MFARKQARAHGKNTGMLVTKFNLKYKVTGSIYCWTIQKFIVEQSRKSVDAIVLGTIQPASVFGSTRQLLATDDQSLNWLSSGLKYEKSRVQNQQSWS